MKRIISVLLAFVLMLSSCANDEIPETTDKKGENKTLFDTRPKSIFSDVSVGQSVFLGEYEQDNDFSNGKEKIEWIILTVEEDRFYAISKYCLDAVPYHNEYMDISWPLCSLRAWLNNDFLNEAFSEEEQNMLSENTYTIYYTGGVGVDVCDKVSLLSVGESRTPYLSTNWKKAYATEYALAKGVFLNEYGGSPWWLSSWAYSDSAANVNSHGKTFENGYSVSSDDIAVRPTIWVYYNS